MKNIFLLIILITGINLHAQHPNIYISPYGNDKNKGTKDQPVASLQRAQQLVMDFKVQQITGDTITVYLREGIYHIEKGLVLGAEDTGTENTPVVYRSYPGEKAVISGAVAIENYRPLPKDHVLYKKDPEVAAKIIEIDLREAGLTEFEKLRLSGFSGSNEPRPYVFRELHFNGKPMPLSRWPNKGFTKFSGLVRDTSAAGERIRILYDDLHISGWKDEPNIILHGYWYHLWADAWEQVEEIDPAKRLIRLAPPYNHYTFRKDHPFAAYNVIAEIDRPGEWAYDPRKGKIYFYPPGNVENATLEFSICKDPLLTLNNTEWITFRDVVFEMGAGEGLRISNSSNINIDHCVIHACARDGIIMEGGNDNTISSCEIYDMGRGGIKVKGGNRETLERSGYLIDNSHIHELSRIDRTYTPGVWVDGVGTTITHCRIHDVPSSAMRINGNEHLVEYNEMYHVVTESDDQGAIDMWGDPTYRGNVFRYNYIHDIGPYGDDEVNAHCGRAGIRLDDAISGNLVFGNVFRNCSGGNFGAVQFHGGKENMVQNNLFVDCSAGISFTSWGYDHWINYTKRSLGFFERNRELYVSRYPELKALNENLNTNTIERNVFIQCDKLSLRQPETALFKENVILSDYPGRANPTQDHYSMKEISGELMKIEFEPIPFEKIGLRR